MNSRIYIWVSGVSIITKLQIQSFSISFTFLINLEVKWLFVLILSKGHQVKRG